MPGAEPVADDMLRPPINRAMRVLDRSFFDKKIPLAAAKIFNDKHISKLRHDLAEEMLHVERLPSVRQIPSSENKALLLKPSIRPNGGVYGLLRCIG